MPASARDGRGTGPRARAAGPWPRRLASCHPGTRVPGASPGVPRDGLPGPGDSCGRTRGQLPRPELGSARKPQASKTVWVYTVTIADRLGVVSLSPSPVSPRRPPAVRSRRASSALSATALASRLILNRAGSSGELYFQSREEDQVDLPSLRSREGSSPSVANVRPCASPYRVRAGCGG